MEVFDRIILQFHPNAQIQSQPFVNEGNAEEDNYLKNTSANRSQTDKLFLFLHGLCLIILAIVFVISLINGDIDRFKKGYDNCGNVCGKNNSFYMESHWNCKAQDMTDKPLLQINGEHRECVEKCNDNEVSSRYQCILKPAYYEEENFVFGLSRSLYKFGNDIIALFAIAIGFAFVMMLMMRYTPMVFIWFSMFGILMVFAAATVFCANLAATAESPYARDSLIRSTIVLAIVTLTVLYFIHRIRKYVDFLIQLLKEAGKAITVMPMLLFKPFLTFMSLAVMWSACFYISLLIASGGTPTESSGKVSFVPTAFMCLADLYNVFMMLWMVQFVCGCQNIIVAGAVSTWYFARDKCRLDRPITNSARNLIKFHLGTISVTSVIIAILQFVRFLLYTLRRTLQFFPCIAYCVMYVQQWMRYYTKNACIITAMHGYPFREAGSRAFNLIVQNTLKFIAMNSLVDFLMILAKVLVAESVLFIGLFMMQKKEDIDYKATVLVLVWLMAYMISHCLFSVYEMAIDTIFICFCEDREVNDGLSRPYYMSAELKEFVEKSQTIVILQANNSSPPKTGANI